MQNLSEIDTAWAPTCLRLVYIYLMIFEWEPVLDGGDLNGCIVSSKILEMLLLVKLLRYK